MAKFRDEVELLISARNEARTVLEREELEQRRLAQRQEAQQKLQAERAKGLEREISSGIVGAALKATAAFGSMELGLGAVNAAGKALSGNIEDAADAVERLPVLGPFARQLRESLGYATGLRQETEGIARATAAINQAFTERRANLRSEQDAQVAASRQAKALRDEIEVLRLRGEQGKAAGEELKIQRQLDQRRERAIDLQREAKRLAEDQAEAAAQSRQRIDELRREVRDAEFAARTGGATSISGIFGGGESLEEIRARVATEIRGEQAKQAEAARRIELKEREAKQELDLLALEQERGRLQQRINAEATEATRTAEREALAKERAAQADRQLAEFARNQQKIQETQARERIDGIETEIERAREQVAAARRRGGASRLPENQADANRFLTGVADDSRARIDRPLLDAAQAEVRAAEENLKTLQSIQKDMQSLLEIIRSSPAIVVGRPQGIFQ